MPKILADENIHKLLVLNLRYIGIDVLWMSETLERKSTTDLEIAKLVNKEKRILITCDTDFIRDVYLNKMVETKIIYIKNRITKENCRDLAERIKEVLKAEGKTFIIDTDSLLTFGEST